MYLLMMNIAWSKCNIDHWVLFRTTHILKECLHGIYYKTPSIIIVHVGNSKETFEGAPRPRAGQQASLAPRYFQACVGWLDVNKVTHPTL